MFSDSEFNYYCNTIWQKAQKNIISNSIVSKIIKSPNIASQTVYCQCMQVCDNSDMIIDIYNKIIQVGLIPDIATLTTLISRLFSCKALEQAEYFYMKISDEISLPVKSYHDILYYATLQKDYIFIDKVIDDIISNHVNINPQVYYYIVHGCSNDISVLTSLFSRMISYGICPRYEELLYLFKYQPYRSDSLLYALRYLKFAVNSKIDIDENIFCIYLNKISRTHRMSIGTKISLVKQILELKRLRNIKVTWHYYNALMNMANETRSLRFGNQIWNEIIKDKIEPNEILYSNYVKLLGSMGLHVECGKIIEEMQSKSIFFIFSFCIEMFVSIYLCNSLLQACSFNGRFDLVYELYKQFISKNIIPNMTTYCHILFCLSKNSNNNKLDKKKYMETIISFISFILSHYTYNDFFIRYSILALSKYNLFDYIRSLIYECNKNLIRITSNTLQYVFINAMASGNIQIVSNLLNDMKNTRLEMSIKLGRVLLNTFETKNNGMYLCYYKDLYNKLLDLHCNIDNENALHAKNVINHIDPKNDKLLPNPDLKYNPIDDLLNYTSEESLEAIFDNALEQYQSLLK